MLCSIVLSCNQKWALALCLKALHSSLARSQFQTTLKRCQSGQAEDRRLRAPGPGSRYVGNPASGITDVTLLAVVCRYVILLLQKDFGGHWRKLL